MPNRHGFIFQITVRQQNTFRYYQRNCGFIFCFVSPSSFLFPGSAALRLCMETHCFGGSVWAARRIAVYEKCVDASFVPFCDLAFLLCDCVSGWSGFISRAVKIGYYGSNWTAHLFFHYLCRFVLVFLTLSRTECLIRRGALYIVDSSRRSDLTTSKSLLRLALPRPSIENRGQRIYR